MPARHPESSWPGTVPASWNQLQARFAEAEPDGLDCSADQIIATVQRCRSPGAARARPESSS